MTAPTAAHHPTPYGSADGVEVSGCPMTIRTETETEASHAWLAVLPSGRYVAEPE